MTDNAKKFLAAVSQDEALKKEFEGAKGLEAMLKIAKAHGYELKSEDFEAPKIDELSEDEMQAVAGGAMQAITSMCKCTGGYGFGLTNELNCECQQKGGGVNTTIHDGDTHQRCWCANGEGLGFA